MAPRAHYDDAATLLDARAEYFSNNDFGDDGGYGDEWVKFKFGPFPVRFPNTDERRRAVRYHDLHHVVTGYRTDYAGEAEIGAWEVSTSCKDHRAAWFLNLGAMLIFFWRWPGRVFRAFVRGRHTRNLYGAEFGDALLRRSVGDVRNELGLDAAIPAARAGDALAFAGWLAVAATIWVAWPITFPLLMMSMRKKSLSPA